MTLPNYTPINRSGFTALELLAVVIVIVVIFALTIPYLRERRAAEATRLLLFAVSRGDAEEVEDLLAQGARVDTVRRSGSGAEDRGAGMIHTMLSLAVRLGHREVAELILENGPERSRSAKRPATDFLGRLFVR